MVRTPRLSPEALRLYLVTDRALAHGRDLEALVAQAVEGGVSCVQLREKAMASRDFLALATALQARLGALGIPLFINDRVDIALACGAPGVHLGQSDLPVADARRLLGPEALIGWSVETPEDVARAQTLDVDYLGVSPVFATPTKTDTLPPWGLEGLASVRRQTRLPLVAIGGVNLGNAAEVLQAGADGLAVVSAICSAPEPRAAAQALRQCIDTHTRPKALNP
jgi:thiamine-phosphate pyrophosphorylase